MWYLLLGLNITTSHCVCDAQVRNAERILTSLLNETETVAPLRSSCASAMSAHSEMLVHFFYPSI